MQNVIMLNVIMLSAVIRSLGLFAYAIMQYKLSLLKAQKKLFKLRNPCENVEQVQLELMCI
jgi:hypothetical protein